MSKNPKTFFCTLHATMTKRDNSLTFKPLIYASVASEGIPEPFNLVSICANSLKDTLKNSET